MSTISSYDSSSIATLFSGFNTSSTIGGGLDFNTYNSIRNGSYGKLLKKYYANESGKVATTDSEKKATDDAKSKTNATSARDAASALIDSSKELRSVSLWSKKTSTDADGKTVTDYDKDSIYKNVEAFVKNYNSMVSATGKSSDNNTLNTAVNMVGNTKANAELLSKVGISIEENNKLSIDESAFKKADMSTVKSIFSGAGSFGQAVAAKASSIYSSSVSELSRLNAKNNYGSNGNYSYVSGSTYSQYT